MTKNVHFIKSGYYTEVILVDPDVVVAVKILDFNEIEDETTKTMTGTYSVFGIEKTFTSEELTELIDFLVTQYRRSLGTTGR